jgi:hypothetical protein
MRSMFSVFVALITCVSTVSGQEKPPTRAEVAQKIRILLDKQDTKAHASLLGEGQNKALTDLLKELYTSDNHHQTCLKHAAASLQSSKPDKELGAFIADVAKEDPSIGYLGWAKKLHKEKRAVEASLCLLLAEKPYADMFETEKPGSNRLERKRRAQAGSGAYIGIHKWKDFERFGDLWIELGDKDKARQSYQYSLQCLYNTKMFVGSQDRNPKSAEALKSECERIDEKLDKLSSPRKGK